MSNGEQGPGDNEAADPRVRNTFIQRTGQQLPNPVPDSGAGYSYALKSRSQAILNSLLSLRASTYRDSTASTEYGKYLRAMSTELGRITLALESVVSDQDWDSLRSEYLYQRLGYLVFREQVGEIPANLQLDDEGFRNFLLAVVESYLEGSTPESLTRALLLFTSLPIELRENVVDSRRPGSPFDISDQFGFRVEVLLGRNVPPELFTLEANLRLLLDLIRPAHTLYRLGFRLSDGAEDGGGSDGNTESFLPITATSGLSLYNYAYEDLRHDCWGLGPVQRSAGRLVAGWLRDEGDPRTNPLGRVQLEAGVTLLQQQYRVVGGQYLVTDRRPLPGGGWELKLYPRPEEGDVAVVGYVTELDRRGRSAEQMIVREDHTTDFSDLGAPLLLTPVGSPLTAGGGTSQMLSAFCATTGAVIQWDLLGDGSYSSEGPTVPWTVPLVPPSTLQLYLRAVLPSGRTRRAVFVVQVV
jgi:hypothetical protein